jgi:hypothetical protein
MYAQPKFYSAQERFRSQYQHTSAVLPAQITPEYNGYSLINSCHDLITLERHNLMMDDFKRANRITGTLYDPIYDEDLSKFKTREEEDISERRYDDSFQSPEIIEDLMDEDYMYFKDLEEFNWSRAGRL